MPRTRPAYPPEFRAQIVALAQARRSVEELAREFEPSGTTIRGWIRAAGMGAAPLGAAPRLTDEEREELRRLRKENRQLRQERDILAKAAAWLAQSDVTSSRSSTS
jgi:transposase